MVRYNLHSLKKAAVCMYMDGGVRITDKRLREEREITGVVIEFILDYSKETTTQLVVRHFHRTAHSVTQSLSLLIIITIKGVY